MQTKCTFCSKTHIELNLSKLEFRNHVRWCGKSEKGTTKYQLVCSCVICKKEISAQNLKIHHNKHTTIKTQSSCKQCNSPIYLPNNFCNRSCSAKYSNARKDWSKIKTGPPKGTPQKTTKPKYSKVKWCIICEKSHSLSGKTCSLECKSILLSRILKEKVANGYNPSLNRSRKRRSYLEKSFHDWLITYYPNIVFIQEYPFANKIKNVYYFGDFFFPELNLLIELDGTQHNTKEAIKYDTERDSYIKEEYNCEIIRISHKEYMNKSKLDIIKNLLEIH